MSFTAWKHTERSRHREKYLLWFLEVWWFQYSTQPPEAVNSLLLRNCHRFFDQVGHQTMYASIENKHFFTKYVIISMINLLKDCKILTISHFSASKINGIFLNFFCEEYYTRRPTFTEEIFWNFLFLKYFIF